jgi:hypothetical protein
MAAGMDKTTVAIIQHYLNIGKSASNLEQVELPGQLALGRDAAVRLRSGHHVRNAAAIVSLT